MGALSEQVGIEVGAVGSRMGGRSLRVGGRRCTRRLTPSHDSNTPASMLCICICNTAGHCCNLQEAFGGTRLTRCMQPPTTTHSTRVCHPALNGPHLLLSLTMLPQRLHHQCLLKPPCTTICIHLATRGNPQPQYPHSKKQHAIQNLPRYKNQHPLVAVVHHVAPQLRAHHARVKRVHRDLRAHGASHGG